MKYIIKNKANKKGAAIKRCLYFLLSLISLTLKFYYFVVAAAAFFVKVSEPLSKASPVFLLYTDIQLFEFLNVYVIVQFSAEALSDLVILWVNVYSWTSLSLTVPQLSIVKDISKNNPNIESFSDISDNKFKQTVLIYYKK